MPQLLEKLTATQFKQLDPRQTVFLIPVTGLDDYGPHLPLGTGAQTVQQLTQLLAYRLEKKGQVVVLLPAFFMATDLATRTGWNVRGTSLKDTLLDYALKLTAQGFLHFIAVTHQAGPRTLTAIEEAGSAFRKRQLLRKILSLASQEKVMPSLISFESHGISWAKVREAPFTHAPSEHGGAFDTASALWLSPNLVDPIYSSLPRASLPPFSYRTGYWGDPSAAVEKKIKQELEAWIELRLPALEEVWAGKNPESRFRSWYSVIPINRTFFKIWLGFFIMLALMGFWIALSVEHSR